MAVKQRFIEILFATCLMLCYTSAQDPTTTPNYGCHNLTCQANQVCRMIEVQCFVAPCYPVPSCVDSTPVCDPDPCIGMICLYGRARDANGCIMCGCIQPCYGITCQDGYECEPTEDPTSNTYIGQCVPTVTRPQCAPTNCDTVRCRFGFKLDVDGCQMGCQCYDPCEGYPCPANKQCLMSADDCPPGEECRDSPMPYCADISDLSPTPTPSGRTDGPVCYPEYCTLNCSNGQVTDENGCLRCQCKGCAPDPCPGMVCLHGKATDQNGCVLCVCYDPCDGVYCPEGQECRPARTATNGTFVGQCIITVTYPPCQKVNCSQIDCPFGFLSDTSGCQTCECRDPCKNHECPANQRCVVSEDDCPAGAECRDAPMPYCVDSSTTAPQSSSTYAFGERGDGDQETLLQCCSSVGMSESCLTVCSTNMTLLYSNLETLSDCFQYLGAFLHCASGGRSHMNCCNQRGISESCSYLCSGNDTLDLSNPHAVTQCVVASSQTVLGCFNEGLSDANMTVSQTSTPSSTTAEDICSMAPDAGNCRAIMVRWYYSAIDRACATFNYGGCDGNGNNFPTRDDCLSRCKSSGSVCPDVQCNASCQITVDQFGCHSCSCGDDCMTNGCPSGQGCRMIPGICPNGTNCPPVPACVILGPDVICDHSAMSNCTISCPKGWMTDESTRCPICQCKTCQPVCDGMVCLYGRVKGSDGCDTCECYNPCQSLSCPDQCHVMRNNLTGIYYGECYRMSTGASTSVVTPSPKPLLCLLSPNYGMSCQPNSTRWFYNQSSNACSSFSYGGCLGNENNFQTKPICEALCKDSAICPQLDCRSVQDCPYGMMHDDNGCPLCQCLDPCQGYECLGNTVCVSRKSDCADSGVACRDPFTRMCVDPSLTTSTTTAASSTTTPRSGCPTVCAMFCPNGFEKDSNGCDICQCLDPCRNCTDAQTCVRMAIDCPVTDQSCTNSLMGYCVDKSTTTSPAPCRLCMMRCPYLMMKDANGCAVCRCYEPCEGVVCTANSTCQVFESDCSTDADCPPNVRFQGQCVEATTTVSTATPTTDKSTTTSPAPCRLCMMRCPYLMMKDANGCAVCRCYEPCEDVVCTGNSTCQVFESDCSTDANCPPNVRFQGQCVEATTTVSTATPTTAGRVSCPPRRLCQTRCTYGNAKDSNGCYTCDCDDPCLRMTCNSTQTCDRVAAPGPCEGDVCWIAYKAICIPACTRQISCNLINCTYGLAKGDDGCDICQCFDPCQNVACDDDEECTVRMTVPPTGYCTVRCPPLVNCTVSCEFGNVKDASGCKICQCYDPCQDQTCPNGETCVPDKTPLYTGQIPERVYISQCTVCPGTMMCMMACPYGYAKDMATECDTCQCYQPCQNVTCRSGQVCIPKLQFNGRYPYVPQCSDITTTTPVSTKVTVPCPPVCMIYCEFGNVRDANGCPTCNCNSNPCASISCLVNQMCKTFQLGNGSYYGRCIDTTPLPTPVSTSGPSTTDPCLGPLCRMYCEFGNVRDANGCPICSCNSDPCASASCMVNTICRAFQLGNGSYYAQCIDATTPTTPTSNATKPATSGPTTTTGDDCDRLVTCLIYCEFGNVRDANGCPICSCNSNPCATVLCPVNQQCIASQLENGSFYGECIAGGVCGPVCMIYCEFGNVRDARGCPLCSCNSNPCASVLCPVNQQCVASQLGNGSYYGQCIDTTTQTPIATKPTTNGPSTTRCSPYICFMECIYGMAKDENGCTICHCNSDPCANVSCRPNQHCVASPLQDNSYYGQCMDCPMPMCMSPCFYGTKPDAIMGCPSCDCRMDPCSTVRCMAGFVCQTSLFCPDSECQPSAVCVDEVRPCDGLERAYEKSFENNLGMMPQLNCDSRGLFQPIQCSDAECWCVDERGTPTTNRSSLQLNCYSGDQTMVTMKIEADINVISPGDGWRFKQQVTEQLSNLLDIDESLVTVRKYMKGSIIADVVIGSNANTDMTSVQEKLNQAKQAPFDIRYDNHTYQAILLGGPAIDVTPGPNKSAEDNVLMIVLICVFVPIGLLAIAITICIVCKICRKEHFVPPRRLSEKSSRASTTTEIDSLESGSDKSYASGDPFATITKDEKIVPALDTTEA